MTGEMRAITEHITISYVLLRTKYSWFTRSISRCLKMHKKGYYRGNCFGGNFLGKRGILINQMIKWVFFAITLLLYWIMSVYLMCLSKHRWWRHLSKQKIRPWESFSYQAQTFCWESNKIKSKWYQLT